MAWKAPTPINICQMPKYKNLPWEEVYRRDPDYVLWYRDTIDVADVKNGGKYAKQNQERLKMIDELIENGPSAPAAKPVAATAHVSASTFETILKVLLSIEEKLDVLMGKKKITSKEMMPDEDLPSEISDEETPF